MPAQFANTKKANSTCNATPKYYGAETLKCLLDKAVALPGA
jgi:hypothetical protein